MNFWTELPKLNQEGIKQTLIEKLGEPNNQLASNCLIELTKRISHYYLPETPKNYTIYTLIGSVSEILEKKFREGKRLNQTYYILKVEKDQLQACQEDLKPQKWNQIKKLAIIGQELVFKYRKFYTNKQLLDYHPNEKNEGKVSMG